MLVLSSPIALISSVPPVTRTFVAFTVVSSAIYANLWWRSWSVQATLYMTLVPGAAAYAPWTFLTSAFVETTIFEFIASLVVVPAALKYLERLWGSIETAKFVAVSLIVSNILAFGLNWIEFLITRNADIFLYGMHYHGQMGLQVALLVAFTQLIPEHQVQLFGFLKARVKSLPMVYLTLSSILCLLGFQCPWVLVQFGWFVGWIYLRFYKRTYVESLGQDTFGDRSETFSLVSWFPPFMHYPLTVLGSFVYSSASRLHLIPSSGPDVETGNYPQPPGTARAEAERRRAMALKALDQRLANNSSPSGSSSTNSPSLSRASSMGSSRIDKSFLPPPSKEHDSESDENALDNR